MAGDEEDSWRSVFSREGYQVICLLKGLGELEKIRFLFAEHAREAMNSIVGASYTRGWQLTELQQEKSSLDTIFAELSRK